eukprot:5893893-Pyramimonas_sp.AAC.1
MLDYAKHPRLDPTRIEAVSGSWSSHLVVARSGTRDYPPAYFLLAFSSSEFLFYSGGSIPGDYITIGYRGPV